MWSKPMASNWSLAPQDTDAVAALAARLPAMLFDAHAHVRPAEDRPEGSGLVRETWRREVGNLVGVGRLGGGLFFPHPVTGDPPGANDWLVARGDWEADDRLLVLAWPGMPRDRLGKWLAVPRVLGIKPYHLLAGPPPTFDLPAEAFCPEWLWEVCAEGRRVIMLHLVRPRALADEQNLRFIQRCCERYPGVQLVLAHAARGFHAPNTMRAVAELAHLDNVWFDTSAVCEPQALLAILDHFGPQRLLWGSDFPVSHQRGRCVTVGDDFAWINPERVDAPVGAPACRTWLVGLESLRAFFEAADRFGLTDADVAAIMAGNARTLLGLPRPPVEDVQALYERARRRLPGGTQLLSKRPEMFAPGQWPAYFREARGCQLWDTDGRRYIDFSINGIGACLLGFRDPDVSRAVQRRVALGSMCTLNPPEELELADLLCALHPWAESVRFARCGGEIGAIAARIARATTGRSKVAICGYHGWQDWYLAANLGTADALSGHLLPGLAPDGVPGELRGTTLTFAFNDLAAFQALLDAHGGELACVVMEAARQEPPQPGFLEAVRAETRRRGILLIFDEITIGFRIHIGGVHLGLGVQPDLAIFAKALGNGHPIAAVIGTAAAMDGAHHSFISSTYWTESVGPAAALAAVRKMQRVDLPRHLAWAGSTVKDIWRRTAQAAGVAVRVSGGFPCMAHLHFEHPEAQAVRTLYTQGMLRRGFLAGPGFYPTLAHTEREMGLFEAAAGEVFGELAEAIRTESVTARLRGPVAHSGFRRLVS
jgi:glutamate-1-semialdehyde 2,1-aminomutase